MSSPVAPDGPADVRLVLYSRAGCHLCEPAAALVAAVAAEAGTGWLAVDVDTDPDAAALTERYGEMVPVVTVDGVVQGYWRLDAERLHRALAAPRRG
ncbi:glutaredoxin family protein [Actinotalea sp.]|uniref:glutaredoxin family protein n=1 Tax=Actinotalea sp. TaxID=1872145 RepID=UPI002D03C4A2|nr:glutaredoxin family protein [Actinotalea sp.]HQY32779.1 glutaredoxin family protein [Actinotalea sp.]HRA50407.1 glutaredoxin family protein [Actinotalea sp.]